MQYVIYWLSERFGLVFAGSVHDWEPMFDREGVLKFDSQQSAQQYLDDNIWEKPAGIMALD